MHLTWYLVVSALIFSTGIAGVLVRRNPLVILLCLELMLNAGNLALVAFARMHGGAAGQVFALIVTVIAACEVACPFDAITMGNDYEMSDYSRSDLIFTKEMLLAEPFERTPLRAEGE